MSQPTTVAVRVAHGALQTFVCTMAKRLGIADEQAELLAQVLIANDLRGVLSHGSRQMRRYTREIQSGRLHPQPTVTRVRETAVSVLMDGDGGLGYFPAYEGTLAVIEKAKAQGMAALVTRNHGHIGAAGIYTRLTLEHDLLAFATSGVQLDLEAGMPIYRAAGWSPMSFSAPGEAGPPLVVDAGVTHDLQGNPPHRDEVARLTPGLVLRALGFGSICQAWGGLLTGLPIDGGGVERRYPAANQGAMLFAFKIGLFMEPGQFKRAMDEYGRRVRGLTPIAGTEGAFLAGHVEAERERVNRQAGIPLGEDHKRELETLGEQLGVAVPWL